MTLGQLKSHIESFPSGTVFRYSLSEPFSWRGVYAEVAFSIEEKQSTKEELLAKIEKALTEEFIGYKGGEFRYNTGTDVHFEEGRGRWTDGEYTESYISKITGEEPNLDSEHRLIKLAFN